MEPITTTSMIGCALALFFGLVAGYLLGARKAKRASREMQQAMNAQSVELLEARAETRKLAKYLGAATRKDRVLKLALNKLKLGSASEASMRQQLEDSNRNHFIQTSRLNLSMVESKQRAKKAALAARDASYRLSVLEKALPKMQTISAPEPKSYGQGEAVTVSIVDKHAPAAKRDRVNKVSNRDLHRLTALRSSNEQVCERPKNTVDFPPSGLSADNKPTENDGQDDISDEQILRNENRAKRAP